MPTVVEVLAWLQKVDLVKWIITIAIPTAAIWSFKWLSKWWTRRVAEKRRQRDLTAFLAGLPQKVRVMIADTFLRQESHTVSLPRMDETVRLAVGLGVIRVVSEASWGADFYFLRRDIWEHLHSDIVVPFRVSNPPDQRANQEGKK
jgi:hypothetical protein